SDAEVLLKEALDGCTNKLGADHPHTLIIKHNLGFLYQSQRKFPQAEALYSDVLRGQIKKGAALNQIVGTKTNITWSSYGQGKYQQAEKVIKEVLDVSIARGGPNHAYTQQTKNILARIYEAQGKHQDAESLVKEVSEVCGRMSQASNSPFTP